MAGETCPWAHSTCHLVLSVPMLSLCFAYPQSFNIAVANCSLTNLSIVGNNKNLTGLLLHSTCQAISSRAGAGVVVVFFGSTISRWTDCSYSFNPFTLSWPLG